MPHPAKRLGFIVKAILVLLSSTASAGASDLSEFIAKGTIILDARDRYEHVEQHGFTRDADAHTIRVRAGYQTAEFWHLKLLAELEATGHLSQAFNDTVNGHVSYPLVPDPENLELNRAQLTYTALPNMTLTIGRQLINLDDQRFIGASAFRQNEQTFDALRAEYAPIPNLSINYIYSDRVNRVFGERSPAGHFTGNVHAFNAAYTIAGIGKAVGYIYLLDLKESHALSTATFGAQFSGSQPIGSDWTARYLAGYAHQSDYANNPLSYSADYWRGEFGLDYQAWSLTGGIESLGGTGTIGFSTPLATLHAFEGYADVFLTTPVRGVNDAYIRANYQTTLKPFETPWKASFGIWYHTFSFARGSGSLGSEIDLEGAIRLTDNWRLDIAHAAYDGVTGFSGRRKTWIAVSFIY